MKFKTKVLGTKNKFHESRVLNSQSSEADYDFNPSKLILTVKYIEKFNKMKEIF